MLMLDTGVVLVAGHEENATAGDPKGFVGVPRAPDGVEGIGSVTTAIAAPLGVGPACVSSGVVAADDAGAPARTLARGLDVPLRTIITPEMRPIPTIVSTQNIVRLLIC